ncbi:MAG: sensor histidine kinase [Turicibacter sp.]
MISIILLILLILVAIPFIFQTIEINRITEQLKNNNKIRVTLMNSHIENLAHTINTTVKNQNELQLDIKKREDHLKQSIADISHDLRTPLTAIQGYLTLLKDCTDEEKEQYLSILEAKSNSLNELVKNFYELSVIDDTEYVIKTEAVDISSILTETIMSNYPLFKEKGITPQIDIPHTELLISGENSACQRIMGNLIANAIKYSNGLVHIQLKQTETACRFMISNSVTGMKQGDLSYLFDRFYMVDKSRTHGGTGLGLYIVKTLLEKIDGTLVDVFLIDDLFTITLDFKRYK